MNQGEINQIKDFLRSYFVGGQGIRVDASHNNAVVSLAGAVMSPMDGGFPPPIPVLYLPALPASGFAWVRWLTPAQGTAMFGAAGTGDGQVWCASEGDDRWHPLYAFTAHSGEPAS